MFKPNLKTLSLAASILVGSLGLAMPTSALTAKQVLKPDLTNLVLGWDVEGRAGAMNGADYELAIGPNGAQLNPASQADWVWQNGVDVPWAITWDSQTQMVSFTFGSLKPITYLLPTYLGQFNQFSLLTLVQTEDGKVEPGTKIDLSVKTINGCVVNASLEAGCTSTSAPSPVGKAPTTSTPTPSPISMLPCLNAPTPAIIGQPVCSSSTAPTLTSGLVLASHESFFTSSESITTMTGTVKMTWSSLNPQAASARSRVDFQIKAYWLKPGV